MRFKARSAAPIGAMNWNRAAIVIVFAACACGAPSDADEGWFPGESIAGADGEVRAMLVADTGDGSALYVGGTFHAINNQVMKTVGRWDGERWSPMGPGFSQDPPGPPQVNALALYEGEIIAGGDFEKAGNIAVHNIARWSGSSWQSLGTGTVPVHALLEFNGLLVAGVSGGIMTWDGTAWTSLGTGLNGSVYALAVYNDDLIAAGDFTMAGGVSANRVALWNGASWESMGSGMNARVEALHVWNGDLYAGGGFTTADGNSARRIARWQGESWFPLGDGLNGTVKSLTVHTDELVAGGNFSGADGLAARDIAIWNGSSWRAAGEGVGTSTSSAVLSLASFGDLIVGGEFETASGTPVINIARWNGSEWAAIANGRNGPVFAITRYQGDLIIGGDFDSSGDISANKIAHWDGSAWLPLGEGIAGAGRPQVNALIVWNDELIAGGNFSSAGGVSVTDIAAWNGETWRRMGSAPDHVNDFVIYQGALVAAGGSGASGFVSRWDGEFWTSLAETDFEVFALAVRNDELVVAGGFNMSGHVMSWDGSAWTEFGTADRPVHAVVVYDDAIIIGGDFTRLNGVFSTGVFRSTGNSWEEMQGLSTGVDDLVTYGDDLIAAGSFFINAAVPLRAIARWNEGTGRWTQLGSGLSGAIPEASEVFVDGIDFWVGGAFTVADGGLSGFLARWGPFTQLATLIDFTVAFGTLLSGGLPALLVSDDAYLIAQSRIGFTANEPNLVDLRIGAESPLPTPQFIDLSIEGRLNQVGGTARVRLRNWATNGLQQVHQYPIGNTEAIEDIADLDATNRVRASDGRIEVSLRQSVLVTFSASGFRSFTDWVGVSVRH